MRIPFLIGLCGVFCFLVLDKKAFAHTSGFISGSPADSLCFKVERLPDLVVFERDGQKEGLSAAYGGVIGETLVVAGGCNFPGRPAAEGGEKAYYKEIYALQNPGEAGSRWEVVGQLPDAAANGASVTIPEGVVCIGGKNTVNSLRSVCLLYWNEKRTKIQIKKLAELPVTMDDMAAATDGHSIYVAGGCADNKPENRCFVLEGIEATEWKELPAFPGQARLQPVGWIVEGSFFLMGGFQPFKEDRHCRIASDGLCLDLYSQQWTATPKIIPKGSTDIKALVGAAGQLWDEHRMIFTGGVDRVVFKTAVDNPVLQAEARKKGWKTEVDRLEKERAGYMKHEPAWYRFNRQVVIFDFKTGKWQETGDFPELARAGAVMLKYKDKWVVVNGETKPGIRSSEVYMITVE